MNFWIVNCAAVFLLSVFCAGIVIPQILLIAFRKHFMDVPDERKIHRSLVPRLGGIAFKPVIFFSIAFVLGVNLALGNNLIFVEALHDARAVLFGFCAVMVLYLVGMADDLIGVRYSAKFVIQIICAVMLVIGGVSLADLHGVLWIHNIPIWVGAPLTVLVVVFITNAINLIDGIDGLASGICGIASLFYGTTFFIFGHYFYAMLCFATFGVLVPFFYYNVFGNPERQKKIFMGDTGSLTIGIILSFISLKMVTCVPTESETTLNPMILAFAPLLVPGFDVVRVYLFRIRNGSNPFLPDKNHIHHKLLALGLKQRTAMICIVTFSLLWILLNVMLSLYINVNLIILIDVVIWSLGNIWISVRIRCRQEAMAKRQNRVNEKNETNPTLLKTKLDMNIKQQDVQNSPDIDYAEKDRMKILEYIRKHGNSCSVAELIEKSGAERLRVYPLIARLSIEGNLKITKFDSWGSPVTVLLME